jgi:hypothetical protein
MQMQSLNKGILQQFRRTSCLTALLAGLALCAPLACAGPADSTPCSAGSPTRELDFWLGDWNITYPGAPGGSISKVSLSLDRCEIVESWEDAQGHKGENRFAYNYENQSWRGMFADNRGHVHVFLDGKAAAGSAEFFGPTRSLNGDTVLHRIKVSRVNGSKVEQTWEISADNGATWSTVFRGEYSRKNP